MAAGRDACIQKVLSTGKLITSKHRSFLCDLPMKHENREEHTSAAMSLGDHLDELRSRLIRSIIFTAAAFILAWLFRETIIALLFRPHIQTANVARVSSTLKFRDYMEPVAVQLKASLAVALTASAPYLLYQIWAFVAPGLFRNERSFFVRLLLASIICFALGAAFGFFLFIPLALRFLLSLAPVSTEPVLMMGSYLSLFLMMTIALGVVFQTPLVIYYLVKWDIVSAETVRSNRKNAVLGAFVLAAFFTPPDPATQVMMAMPMIVLYEVGMLIAAPTRKAFIGFLKLLVGIGIAVGVVVVWHQYAHTAKLENIVGKVAVNGRMVQEMEVGGMRRGDVLETEPESSARIKFGLFRNTATIILGEKTGILFEDHAAVRLNKGAVLVAIRQADKFLRLGVGNSYVIAKKGLAEIRMKNEDTFKVSVAEGNVNVAHMGREINLPAGSERIFQLDDLDVLDERRLKENWGDIYDKW